MYFCGRLFCKSEKGVHTLGAGIGAMILLCTRGHTLALYRLLAMRRRINFDGGIAV